MTGTTAGKRPAWVPTPPPPDRLAIPGAGDPLTVTGERVRIAPVHRDDLEPYARAVELSRARLEHWNPVDPTDLDAHLRFQSTGHRTFVVHALQPDPAAGHDIVGRVNVTNVVRGRAMAATMGYDSYDPYAGTGLFAEGLRLVVDLVFAPEPRGMALHRVEASVQPGNVRSAGLLRSLGFRPRGAWSRYLWLGDASDEHAWRDHVTYGVTAEEWPTSPYAAAEFPRPVVLLQAGAGADEDPGALAALVAQELRVPVFDGAAVAALGEELAGVLRAAPGAVLVRPAAAASAGAEPVAARVAGWAGVADTAVTNLSVDAWRELTAPRHTDGTGDAERALRRAACRIALDAAACAHAALLAGR